MTATFLSFRDRINALHFRPVGKKSQLHNFSIRKLVFINTYICMYLHTTLKKGQTENLENGKITSTTRTFM